MGRTLSWHLLLMLLMPFVAHAADPRTNIRLTSRFGIELEVDQAEGTYRVLYRGQPWFGKGIVSALVNERWYRSVSGAHPQMKPYSGSLELKGANTGTAKDKLGVYDFVDLTWEVPAGGTRIVTGFRLYRERPFI